MTTYEKAYKSYKKKCKELGIKPSPQEDIFVNEIVKEKNDKILKSKIKRVPQTEEEKRLKRNAQSRKEYHAKR